MNNLRPFQLVLLAFFGLLALAALVFLSVYQANKQQTARAYGNKVEIWGTLPQATFKELFQEIVRTDKAFTVVTYKQVSEVSFDDEFVNAVAEGRSPDLVLLGADRLVKHRVKLQPISYTTLPLREFKDTFVDGSEIFALEQGVYALPLLIDPLVMYWNRDLFSSNGLSQPPKSWEQVVNEVVPKITLRSNTREITQSGLSFGEYRNVENAKKILLMLALQTGSKMITTADSKYKVGLNESQGDSVAHPFESVVQFYTDFSNVNSPLYSWNRAVSSAKSTFLAGNLALYFGLGSEYKDIADKNPNLNFDIAQVPQGAQATVLRTYGDIYALTIPKASVNQQGAFAVAKVLTNKSNAKALSEALSMAPARRDAIAVGSDNPFRKVVLQSALIVRAWLDPEKSKSEDVFRQMVEDVVSNRARVGGAVKDAIDRLKLAF